MEVRQFGLLQIADKWSSFTGRARFPDGAERSVTVIIDGETIVIDADGRYHAKLGVRSRKT